MSKLENALEVCLARLEKGEQGLEECLALFPEHEAELRPMLAAAQKVGVFQELNVRPEFRTSSRLKLAQQMVSHPPRRRTTWGNSVALRYAASFAVLFFALVTTGTALAQSALPGDALYSWKLASERLWRSVQQDLVGADFFLAQRRVDELGAVKGMPGLETIGVDAYIRLIEQLKADLEHNPERTAGANEMLMGHKELLRDLFSDSQAELPEIDEVFTLFPLPQNEQPDPAQEEDADQLLPLLVTPLPAIKKEDEQGESSGERQGTFEEIISDWLALP